MGTLYRAQIPLKLEQHQALAEIAQDEGSSLSALVREIVHQYLAAQEQKARTRRELQAIEALRRTRLRLREQHGVYQTDLIGETRAERNQDKECVRPTRELHEADGAAAVDGGPTPGEWRTPGRRHVGALAWGNLTAPYSQRGWPIASQATSAARARSMAASSISDCP